MKKILFTAMAVVVFSSVSMASSIEVKEVKKEAEKKEVVKVKEDCCLLSAADAVDSWCSNYEMTDVEANELYQFSYALCRGDEYGDSINY